MNGVDLKIDKIYQYIVKHYTRTISLEEIAEYVGMNRNSFCNYFKTHTGKSFVYAVNEYRIHRAALLLYNSEQSTIKEIAYCVGFGDPSYFNRVFHSFKGCSPKIYRRKYGENS